MSSSQVLLIPSGVARNCSKPAGGPHYRSDSTRLSKVAVPSLNQRVQIRQIVLRKQIFLKEVPKMDCFARYSVATKIF